MFKNLAYTPIDLPNLLLDEKLLIDIVNLDYTGANGGLWLWLPLIGRVESQECFQNPALFEKSYGLRYRETGEVIINEYAYTKLKPLYDHMQLLPLEITHAQIVSQTADTGQHFDLKKINNEFFDDYPGVNDCNEPASYRILLNQFDKESFYVAENFGQSNHYIHLPADTNTFAFNEKTYLHGADKLENPKFIVVIFGLIDTVKHLELVKRSKEKYKKYTIEF